MSGHTHDHGVANADDPDSRRGDVRRALWLALGINAVFLVVEVVGGVMADSLALLADAGHMFTDVLSLALALLATWVAARGATARRSYGWQRAEIIAALLNGLGLVLVSILIAIEAVRRFQAPPPVSGPLMLTIAFLGLVANAVSSVILYRVSAEDLNARAAFLHMAADMMGSVGALIAAVLISGLGWYLADPIIGVLIGVLILFSSWNLVRESISILLESAPHHIDQDRLLSDICSLSGVTQAHDLHVWTVATGYLVLTVHVVAAEGADGDDLLHRLNEMFARQYGITHTTVQVGRVSREHSEHRHA